MINFQPRALAAKAVTYRSKQPTKMDTIRAILINTFSFTVIIGSILWVSTLSDDTQPGPTKEEKAQVKKEQSTPNWPTYDEYKGVGAELCGAETGKAVLKPMAGVKVARAVIVVRMDGVMERMDTSEAWKRAESKTRADDVWAIGICKTDILDRVDIKVVG